MTDEQIRCLDRCRENIQILDDILQYPNNPFNKLTGSTFTNGNKSCIELDSLVTKTKKEFELFVTDVKKNMQNIITNI